MKLQKAIDTNVRAVLYSILLSSSLAIVDAQDSSLPAADRTLKVKTLVVATEAKSDSAIAIPPAAFSFVAIVRSRTDKHNTNSHSNLLAWIRQESALNGLQSADVHPWHLVVTYDEFDEDGDNVHSGTFEELWAGPTKYTRIYKSDNFNQADLTGDFCTSGSEREFTREGSWYADEEIQAGADRDVAAAS